MYLLALGAVLLTFQNCGEGLRSTSQQMIQPALDEPAVGDLDQGSPSVPPATPDAFPGTAAGIDGDGFQYHVYVAVDGDDARDGRASDRPVRTLSRARAIVRDLIASGLIGKVAVHLGPGLHALSEPLDLTAADSHPVHAIVWRGSSSGAQRSVVSGGIAIPDEAWESTALGANIYRAPVARGDFRQLYSGGGGRRLIRAASTNVANMGLVGSDSAAQITEWTVNAYYQIVLSGAPALPAAADEFPVELVVPVGWAVSRFPMAGSFQSAGFTYFSPRVSSAGINPGWVEALKANPGSGVANAHGPFHLGTQKAYFEGHFTFIDQPDEWAVDRTNGFVYLKADQPAGRTGVIVPNMERLIRISGAFNLVFQDLDFAHTNWSGPNDEGYIGFHGSSEYKVVDAAGNLRLRDQPFAIEVLDGSRDIWFVRNRFYGIGASALHIRGVTEVNVLYSSFAGISGTAVHAEASATVKINSNRLWNIGLEFAGDGVHLFNLRNSSAADNDFTAIAGRAVYAVSDLYGAGVTIHQNRIQYATTLITDAGAINTGGQFHITDNQIANATLNGWNSGGGHNIGIYLDVFSFYSVVTGNQLSQIDLGISRNCEVGSDLAQNSFTAVTTPTRQTYIYCKNLYSYRPDTDPWKQAMIQLIGP